MFLSFLVFPKEKESKLSPTWKVTNWFLKWPKQIYIIILIVQFQEQKILNLKKKKVKNSFASSGQRDLNEREELKIKLSHIL